MYTNVLCIHTKFYCQRVHQMKTIVREVDHFNYSKSVNHCGLIVSRFFFQVFIAVMSLILTRCSKLGFLSFVNISTTKEKCMYSYQNIKMLCNKFVSPPFLLCL